MKSSIGWYLVFSFLIFVNTAYSRENDFITINPFKLALDGLSNRAQGLLNNATNAGLILETNGAEQALNIIATTQQAYEKELNATSHVINGKEQQIISGITGILDQIQNHTIANISSQITKVALMLPPVGKNPQLTTWSGNVIVPNESNITVKLEGIFKYAGKTGYEPTMKIGNDIYKPSVKTPTNLSFDIPLQKFQFLPNKVSYVPVSFNIPYDNHFFQPKQYAEFKIKLILLPNSSGKFEFITSTFIDERVTLPTKSCVLEWHGQEDAIKLCYPDPGYIIDVNTINTTLTGEAGSGFGHDHYDLGRDFNKPEVGISYHIRGDDNQSFVQYTVKYSMFKMNSVPIDKSLGEESFKWGNSKTYTITEDKATWKAVYTDFSGRKVAFASNSENNPYVHIKQVANQVTVNFAPFD